MQQNETLITEILCLDVYIQVLLYSEFRQSTVLSCHATHTSTKRQRNHRTSSDVWMIIIDTSPKEAQTMQFRESPPPLITHPSYVLVCSFCLSWGLLIVQGCTVYTVQYV